MEKPANSMADPNWIRVCDYKARCWVQGSQRQKLRDGSERVDPDVASFSPTFQLNPLVRQSIIEGWDRELRGHIVPVVRKRLVDGGHVADLTVNELMPNADWIEAARTQAKRAREAKDWREQIIAKHGSVDAFLARSNGRTTTTFKRVVPDMNFFSERGWAVPDRSSYLRKGGAA